MLLNIWVLAQKNGIIEPVKQFRKYVMKHQSRAIFSIGTIMAFRMLGLFSILPIIAIAGQQMAGSNMALIGLAVGIYGFSQACLQIPFGALSDRYGRKPIILLGLILFTLGSIVAALSHTIYGVIAGRALQGTGAIGSTCLALVADLTPDESRSKSMAMIGMTIGFSFLVAIIMSPWIYSHFALNGLFWFTALLAIIAIALLLIAVPQPPHEAERIKQSKEKNTNSSSINNPYKAILSNTQLQRLNLAIFIQHAMMSVMFLVLPFILKHDLHLSLHEQTLFYGCILIIAFLAMVPFIIIAEKKRLMKKTLLGAIVTLLASQFFLPIYSSSLASVTIALILFFSAFTLLESLLPSLVSKIAPINLKGTAMGIYSSSQFLGIFLGGTIGGVLNLHYGTNALFILNGAMLVLWFIATKTMSPAPYNSTLIFKQPETSISLQQLTDYIKSLPGVADTMVATSEKLVYIKADKQIISENELRNALEPVTLNKLI